MRWALRHRRTWAALAAAAVAPLLASRDHRTGWTVLVAIVAWSLAAASVWVDYAAAHPDRAARRAARQQREVRAILYRYENKGRRGLTRAERRELRQRQAVDEIVRRYEAQRAAGPAVPPPPARGRRARMRAREQAGTEALLDRYEEDRAARARARR